MIRSPLVLVVLVATFLLTGCNLYGGIGGPSGNDQLLSAARAAFDQGDYDDAMKYYQQLSGNDADIGLSESAYVGLTKAGASMKAYAAAFGKGNASVGPAITTFAEGILAQGSGQATRVAIWQAFNQQASIGDPNLKALVGFLGSLSFAAEILAETSTNGAKILKTDLNDGKVNVSVTAFPATLSAAALANVNVAAATYNMFNSALTEVFTDVGNLHASGTFGASTLTFANSITSQFTVPGSQGLVPAFTTAYTTILTTAPVSIGE